MGWRGSVCRSKRNGLRIVTSVESDERGKREDMINAISPVGEKLCGKDSPI